MQSPITVQDLTENNLAQITMIHQKAFVDSALTKLGARPILRYYKWLLTGPYERYAIGAFDQNNVLLGFCFSGIFSGSLINYIENDKVFLFKWILTHPWLVFSPLVVNRIKLVLSFFSKKGPENPFRKININDSFGILSIAVSPENHGLGIGRIIMQAVESEAFNRGFNRMHLTVHPTNDGAITFYERCGWKKLTVDNDPWAGFMFKNL